MGSLFTIAGSQGREKAMMMCRMSMLCHLGRGGLWEASHRHATLENDLSVHLHWESDRPEQNGTALGLRLAQALKEFGLTDHSIWIEDQR